MVPLRRCPNFRPGKIISFSDYARSSGWERGLRGTAGFPGPLSSWVFLGARASCPHGPPAGRKPALPWNNNPRKLPSAGNSGGTAARISVSHTGSRTAPRHQCPNADCGPDQTPSRATRTTARTASLPETNTLYTSPRTHAASCCSLRVRAPAPPGWKLPGKRRPQPELCTKSGNRLNRNAIKDQQHYLYKACALFF